MFLLAVCCGILSKIKCLRWDYSPKLDYFHQSLYCTYHMLLALAVDDRSTIFMPTNIKWARKENCARKEARLSAYKYTHGHEAMLIISAIRCHSNSVIASEGVHIPYGFQDRTPVPPWLAASSFEARHCWWLRYLLPAWSYGMDRI